MTERATLNTSPFGMATIFRTVGEDLARGARMAQDAGIRWNRDDFLWRAIQPTKNEWRWETYDR